MFVGCENSYPSFDCFTFDSEGNVKSFDVRGAPILLVELERKTMKRLSPFKYLSCKINKHLNVLLSELFLVAIVCVVFFCTLFSGYAQSGGWDALSQTGTTGIVDHGNGVIQLLDNANNNCQGAAVHETSDKYDPTIDGVFNKCYEVYFGCPGQDEIGSDSKGDGLAFSFSKCANYDIANVACGGGLGYSSACPQMMTIEFDTYASVGAADFDAGYEGTGNNDQIAIHRNGDATINGKIAGADPGNLEDGLEHTVCITYDPSTGVLSATIDGIEAISQVLPPADRLETYFGAGGLNQTWSSGKFGATNPATVSDGADISDNVGGPLCPSSVTITSHENGDNIGTCGGTIQIAAFTSPPAGNTIDYVEFFVGGGSIGIGTADPSNPGFYNIDWTPELGTRQFRADAHYTPSGTQINSYDVTVNVISSGGPTAADAGVAQTICETGGATLAANTPGGGETGTWSGGAGSFSTNANDPVAVYTPHASEITAGSATLTWTIDNGGSCPATTDDVTITIDPIPVVASAGSDETICEVDTKTLAANAPDIGETGTWSGGLGQFSTNVNDPLAVYTPHSSEISAGSATLTWTIDNGGECPATTDNVIIAIDASPTVADAGDNQTQCATTVTLDGNVATVGVGTWSGSATFVDDNDEATQASALANGITTLSWTITNGVCDASSDDVDITVSGGLTAANAGGDQTICETETAMLAANAVGAGETGTWSGGAGSYSTNSNDPMAVYTPDASEITAGSATLTWTIDNGGVCTATTDEVVITIDASPSTANAGTNQNICSTTATLAGNTPTVGVGTWSGTGVFVNENNGGTDVSGLSSGTNTLIWTMSNGVCPDSDDQVEIEVTGGITTSNAGIDQTICETETVTLSANAVGAGETGTWSGGTGSYSTNSNDPTAVYTPDASEITAGSATLTWTIDNGGVCTATTDEVVITIDALPSAANAGTNQNICSTTTTLAGNTPTVGVGTWSGMGTFVDENDGGTVVSGLPNGSSTLTWTISNGVCPDSDDQVEIEVTGGITTSNAGIDQTICETETVTLSANAVGAGETGTWSGGTGSYSTNSNDPTAVYTPDASEITAGSATLTWTIDNGGVCTATTDEVVITIDALPSVADGGSDQDICLTTANLDGNSPVIGTGTWSGVGSFTNANDSKTQVSGLPQGATVLTWTITNGVCSPTSDAVTINVSGNMTAANAGPDQTICESDGASLAANTPALDEIGQWTSGAGTFSTTDNDPITVYTPSASEITAGSVTLTWTIDNGGSCPVSTDQVTITIVDQPTVALAGQDQTICETSEVRLQANSVETNENGLWSGGDGQFSTSVSDPEAVYSLSDVDKALGSTTLMWTIDNGVCPVSSDQVIITIDKQPTTAIAGDDQTVEEGTEAQLGATSLISGAGSWSGGIGTFSDVNDPKATYLPGVDELNAVLVWTTSNGLCPTSSDELRINVIRPIRIPNAFTPNGDGDHDDWNISGIETYSSAWLQVFNRWGNLIFEEMGTIKPWDGTRNGKDMPVATYYYVLNLGDGTTEFSGNVTVIR